MTHDTAVAEAVLLVGFGGPEGPEDVVPFLERVTRGRGIPRERLVEVGAHYAHFGGVSPLNEQNAELRAALEGALRERDVLVPVALGNRNWPPLLPDVLTGLAEAGARRVVAVLTAAYSSYSGCRQYRENLADASAAALEAGHDVALVKLPPYYDRAGFLEPLAEGVLVALDQLRDEHGADVAEQAHLVFSTHSVPLASAAASGPPGRFDPATGGAYVAQHRWVAEQVVAAVQAVSGEQHPWELVYQSRSGPPGQPWLEPDVGDRLVELAGQGAPAVVVVPLGFLSDHVEVQWDIDVVAAEAAAKAGLPMVRSATVGTDARFVAMLADLVVEALGGAPGPPSLAPWGAMPAPCAAGCCANPRAVRPAACEEPS